MMKIMIIISIIINSIRQYFTSLNAFINYEIMNSNKLEINILIVIIGEHKHSTGYLHQV